jgi:hypothetical protein
MRVQKYKDYYMLAKNKYILKPIVDKESYIYYKHYCINGLVDWDFNLSAKLYTEPAKNIIKYSAYSSEDCSYYYYYGKPHKKYLFYTYKKVVPVKQHTHRKNWR